ncbi:MAG TPA: ferredoxin--NADP reductase [Ohtaekwangia sp.]|uniref:ferredoxin--NADP reductase n=1 Tax=Ohtaekwangia sp. TaxID=2066019 RepID=UPI002F93E3DC
MSTLSSVYKKIIIRDIISETQDVKTFKLGYADGSPLEYEAGQFITFVFPKHELAEERRSYSFSTAPKIDDVPAITLKRVTNGEYSRWFIDHAKPGDALLTIGTSGYFTLPDDLGKYKRLILLAAGSGITPIFSLLKRALQEYPSLQLVLIYSNRTAADTIFYNELIGLQQEYSERLTIEFLFSTSPNLLRARLNKGLLENLLKKYSHDDHAQSLFYLCGPYDYMRMATIVLQTEGVPPENIRRENFAIVKPVQKRFPPDQEQHAITLYMEGNRYTFEVQFPETILQQAKKNNIPIPYSCESGQCGTCAATCTKGHVWMWNNEVLTDSEIQKGRVLTCSGYPVGGDVVLEI